MENDIIIQDQSNFNLSTDAEAFLKFNKGLKELGIKILKKSSDFYAEEFNSERDITILVRPSNWSYDYLPSTYFSDVVKKFKEVDSFSMAKSSSSNPLSGYGINGTELLYFNSENKSIGSCGIYIKDKNIIYLYIPIYQAKYAGTLEFTLDILKKEFERLKIKKVKINIDKEVIERFTKYLKDSKVTKQIDMDQRNRDIDSYVSSIHQASVRVQVLDKELMGIDNYLKDFGGKFNKEIIELKKVKFVKKVKLEKEGIIFTIPDVIIKYNNKYYDLGDFTITVNTNQSFDIKGSKTITYTDSSGSPRFYYHPHIGVSSRCLGSFEPKVINAITGLRFKEMALLINMILHTYNHGDCLKDISEFEDFVIKNPDKKLIEGKPITTLLGGNEIVEAPVVPPTEDLSDEDIENQPLNEEPN